MNKIKVRMLIWGLGWGYVCSAQRSAARARLITEELEETRQAFKEVQDRASHTQSRCTILVHIKS